MLWAAVAGNQTETAELMIERNVDVNMPSKVMNDVPTDHSGKFTLCLLDAYDASFQDGWTPLHVAAYFGREDMVRTLLDFGAETEARYLNAYGWRL